MAGQPSQTPLHQMAAQPFGGSPRQGSHQRSPQQSVPHVPHGQPAYGTRGTPPSPQQATGGPRPMYQGQAAGYYGPRPAYGQTAAYPGAPYYPAYPAAPYNPYPNAPYMYYGQPGAAAVPQQQAPAPRPTPARKSHAIQIIDPNTGKEVNLKGQAKEDKAEGHKDDAEKPKSEDAKKHEEEQVKHESEETAAKDQEGETKTEKEEKTNEEVEKAKKEEEEKERAHMEEEEKERACKEEEEKERLQKEDEERHRKEEQERLRQEEEERVRKEEEERLKKEEEEQLKKGEEERLRKEEEERVKKEEEEKKLAEEMERLRIENEEKKRKEDEVERLRKEEETRKAEEERSRKEDAEKESVRQEQEAKAKEAAPAAEEEAKEAVPAAEEVKATDAAPAAEAAPAEGAAEEAPATEEPKAPIKPPTYAPGCWSPEHQDLKRVYTLEFLMAFMDLVTKRPEGQVVYPEVDRVLAPEQAAAREGGAGAGRGARRQDGPMRHMGGGPGYRQGPGGDGGFRGPAGAGMRREPSLGRGRGPRGGPGMMMPVRGPGFGMPGMMPGMHGMPMRPMYEPPVEKLKISENAWRPPVKVDPSQVDDPEQKEKIENELLFRKFKGLLNKLTYDKFEKLTEQIMALEINTSTRLKGAIYIVFDKALDEPTFSSMYAQLCLRMSKWEIPGDGEEGKPKNTFRRHLLNKCQDEFEKEREFTVSEKSVAAEDEDETMVRAKLRMLGNIKFIGELFKLDMLTDKIMHQCVWRLLQPKQNSSVPPEESLESLCQLLSTIGRKLDVAKARDHMNAYFDRLKLYAEKKDEVSSRIRFMIQDAVELRESNWVPRRAEAKAKTIEEVHKEMQQEQVTKALARSTSQGVGRQDSRGMGRHDSRPGSYGAGGRGGGGGGQPSADGWTAVGGSGRQNKPADLGALRSMQSRAASTGDSASVTLGPSGRGGMGARGWGMQRQGSGKGDQQQQQQQQPAVPQMHYRNQFDILNSTDAADDKGPSLRPNIAQLRPQAPSPKNMRSLSPTQHPAPSSASAAATSPAPSPKPTMSEEEFQKKAKSTLEEYYSIRDLKEAITCIKELESPQLHKCIVECLFSVVDDKKKRPEAATLLVMLAEEGLVTRDDILNGVDNTFEMLDDLSMDMPKLDEYMAQYLAPLVSSGRITLADIGKSPHWEGLVKDMMSMAVAKMFAAILTQIASSSDQETAKKLWSESGLQWSSLLPENKTPEDFLASNNLAYLAA